MLIIGIGISVALLLGFLTGAEGVPSTAPWLIRLVGVSFLDRGGLTHWFGASIGGLHRLRPCRCDHSFFWAGIAGGMGVIAIEMVHRGAYPAGHPIVTQTLYACTANARSLYAPVPSSTYHLHLVAGHP